jgi:hypothetical protein
VSLSTAFCHSALSRSRSAQLLTLNLIDRPILNVSPTGLKMLPSGTVAECTIRTLRDVRQSRVGAACAANAYGGPVCPLRMTLSLLRSWALTPDDALLTLKEIALRILSQESEPNPGA